MWVVECKLYGRMTLQAVHFLSCSVDDHVAEQPAWLDTMNVPAQGSVDLIMDFTDPIIRGVSLFHGHLLSHEDKGMMAKIPFGGACA